MFAKSGITILIVGMDVGVAVGIAVGVSVGDAVGASVAMQLDSLYGSSR
jgi:hypothetical protein